MLSSYIADHCEFLRQLSKPELLGLWAQLLKKDPPLGMRKDLLLRLVAQQLQEQEFSGLCGASCHQLRRLATTLESHPEGLVPSRPRIKPGTRLVRQWKGQVHVVTVKDKGYAYKDDRYQSLSEIARRITGTQWSGPLFFGLKAKPVSISTEAQ